MEQITKKGFNYKLVGNDLDNCCRGEALCGQCQKQACIIGFAKQCIHDYQNEPKKEIPDGASRVPTADYKEYEEVELEIAIAHILKECKECREDHVDNCIINVIRNCYEVGLFGDAQPYEGSALQYVMRIKDDFPEKSVQIAEIYRSRE